MSTPIAKPNPQVYLEAIKFIESGEADYACHAIRMAQGWWMTNHDKHTIEHLFFVKHCRPWWNRLWSPVDGTWWHTPSKAPRIKALKRAARLAAKMSSTE